MRRASSGEYSKKEASNRSMSDNKRSINPQEESEQSTSDEEPESSYSGNQCIGSEKCSIAKDRPRRVDVRPP